MPYNTRRKSLSLPSLGIHLPKSQQHHHSAGAKGDQPPQKRLKREHSSSPLAVHYDLNLNLPPSPPPESTTGATVSAATATTTTTTATGTRARISHDGINDEIVSGVVDVLERTDNRPHTVKELAAVLSPVLSIVENSANPHAIISSRLNTFLKRGFSPASPCVLAKQLITTHPKRIYFYLTTSPHKPIPKHENDPSRSPPRRAVVSPALSDDDGHESRRRLEPSPSPEVDLSSHDLDHVDDTTGPPSPACSSRDHQPGSLAQKSSLSSPPLEGDEREFSQSAIYIGRRSSSHEAPGADMALPMMSPEDRTAIEASPLLLDTAKREHHHHHHQQHHHHPRREEGVQQMGFGNWSGELERYLASPESVELDELDGLLDF